MSAAALTVAAIGIATTVSTVAISAGPANGATVRGFDREAAHNGDIARVALAAVESHRSAVPGGTAQAFQVRDVLVDPDGTRNVRMTRTFHGLPVLGGDLVVHQSKSGAWQGRSQTLTRGLSLSVDPSLGEAAAGAKALAPTAVTRCERHLTQRRTTLDP